MCQPDAARVGGAVDKGRKMAQFTNEDLRILQALPLDLKIRKTQNRIEDWYMQFCGEVYVSFSGGKDSTVLLHLVRSMYPDVPAVFCNTGLEYPELRHFAENTPNTTVLHPKMTFDQVITRYGYPIVSKETAEAIYYARRIVPSDLRGGYTAVRKQRELLGKRRSASGVRFLEGSETTATTGSGIQQTTQPHSKQTEPG